MKILCVQSGGPSPGSNPALAGALSACSDQCELYGAIGGWLGLVEKRYARLNGTSPALLSASPSPYLVTFRDKLEVERIISSLEELPFDGLLVIGGEGSMAFLHSIRDKLKVPAVGVAKTIDNDLGPFHHDLGYPSSAEAVADFFTRLAYDSSSYIGYVEADVMQVMGRDAGWLTLASSLAAEAAPDIILLPELTYDLGELLEEARRAISRRKKALIAIAEGATVEGNKIMKAANYQRAGSALALKEVLQESGIRARFEWPGILYRCVEPNERDKAEGIRLGKLAVKKLKEGTDCVMGPGEKGEPALVELDEARKRYVPPDFVEGFSVSNEGRSYLESVVSFKPRGWTRPLGFVSR